MSVASAVARAKERHPEQYCPAPRCLWHTGGGPCPRHVRQSAVQRDESEAVVLQTAVQVRAPLPEDARAALAAEAAEEWLAEEEANEQADRDRAERGSDTPERRA
jgi:hypothetical protein